MQTRQLEKRISRYSARTASELDARSRSLREAGLLPVIGRGPYAAHLGPDHLKNFLFGLASPKATDAADAVRAYDPILPLFESFAGASTFGGAVATAMADPDLAETIHRISLHRTAYPDSVGPLHYAEIMWRGPKDRPTLLAIYAPRSHADKFRAAGGSDFNFGRSVVLDATVFGGGFLAMVAFNLLREEVALPLARAAH
jgi:hypothetical protein